MVVDCDTPVMATTLVHTYVRTCTYACVYIEQDCKVRDEYLITLQCENPGSNT